MIPYSRQYIDAQDIAAVVDVLNSDLITQGPVLPQFEEAVSSYTGSRYAIGVNSATSALHLACLSLKLGPGDFLWTTPITFVASANCGIYCGANVDFVDVDESTANICVVKLEAKLREAKKLGQLPKVLVVVHFAGQPCNLQAIHKLSLVYGFKIIEDASHAIGATYLNGPVGNCEYSDLTVFSFHPVKIMTTAEGGMIVTNNKNIADSARMLRSHGITRDPDLMSGNMHGDWYYQQITLGFNYRLSDIHAALGLSQLKRLDSMVESRRNIAMKYDQNIDRKFFTPLKQELNQKSAWHLYVVKLNLEAFDVSRRNIFQRIREHGIGVNVHYIPVHLQPYYVSLGFHEGDFPCSENYYERAISLPIFPGLSLDKQEQILTCLNKLSLTNQR